MSSLTAVLVGKTQSNMSTPRAVHTTRSTANPTPMQYLGLLGGSKPVHWSTTLQKESFSSPPLRPPIAYPGVFLFTISAMQMLLNLASSPP